MSEPLEVFCCYAREDQEMLKQLKKHLAAFLRRQQIKIWSDSNLNAGIEWEKELHQHLKSADIILLLISPDFIDSDYCYGVEMKRALERHNEGSTRVIPIRLRPVNLQDAPFAHLQIIPTDAIPVTRWANFDHAYEDIANHISKAISELQMKRQHAQINSSAEGQHEYAVRPSTSYHSISSVYPQNLVNLMVFHTLTYSGPISQVQKSVF